MYPHMVTQWIGQSLEDVANQILYTGYAPRDVGVVLYNPGGMPVPPISGEVIVAISELRKAGLL